MTDQPSVTTFHITSTLNRAGGDGIDPMIVNCGCPACALTSADGVAAGQAPHVAATASASATGDARQYEILTQTRNADGSYSFSGDRNIDAVLIGSRITSTDLTFAFPDSAADYGANYDTGQSATLLSFNDLQREATRAGFAMVASYTNLTFREVSPAESVAERATFRLAQTRSNTVQSAMGNFPHSPDNALGQNPSGDIWFGRTQQPYYTNPEKGNWGYTTILHEIGHTLGLKHGGDDYTAFDLSSLFGSTTPLFGTRSLEWAKDGQLWSLMTYSTAPGTRNAYNGEGQNNAQSYMMYDIAALQYLYGANYATNATDTVYRWDERTGEGFVNDVGRGAPTGNKVLETIWDGGGNDTYDLSNYTGGVSVDLRPGATSVLSAAQLANAEAYLGLNAPMQGSVGNALLYRGDTRSLIENAIGGAGNDVLVGNQANNLLVGNDGDDLFDAMQGSDTVVGGGGSDTVSFASATAGITVALNDGAADIRVVNGADTDILRGIENVAGTAYDDRLTGDGGDNLLAGGAGGNDVLTGGAGDDRLIGGGFDLLRPALPDIVKGGSRVNGTLATAVSVDGSFHLAERYGVENAATIPHATIVGTTARAGYEYYSFSGKAGATVTLDVDLVGGNIYPGLLLLDSAGRTIASNYESLKRDEGSRLAADPKLVFILPADGIYYTAVTNSALSGGTLVSTNLPVGFAYTLNVSLEGAAVPTPTLLSTATAVMDGGAGDDLLVGTMGDDVMSGGEGRDTVSFEQSYLGVLVDLGVTGAQATGAGRDTITGIENVTGSRQADLIVGDEGDNVIDGLTGADTLLGGDGVDTLSFARQIRAIGYDLNGQGAMQTARLGEAVLASGFENLTGSAFADTLSGDAGANVVAGGGGDDILTGDSLGRVGSGVDTLIGGAGSDTASFAGYATGVVAGLARDQNMAVAGGTIVARLIDIENLRGGSGNDWLTGSATANVLSGGEGNDRLDGLGGDDVLDGGMGDDILNGGDGIDTAVYTGSATIDLRLTTAQNTGHGRDTLRGIENLRLGNGTNTAIGDGGANVFQDGGGNDAIDGGAGVDTIDYSLLATRVTVDLNLATAQPTGAGSDTVTGIENLIGGNFRNRFFGDGAVNRLVGGSGIDTLVGGGGEDVLFGGAGNDLLIGDTLTVGDLSHVDRGDYIDGGDGYDSIIGGQGDDTLIGGTGNDTIVNGSRAVTLTATGFVVASGNTLDGGNDVIDGGEGIDYAILQFGGRTDDLSLDLSREQAVNYLYSDGTAVGSVTSIERVLIYGGNGSNNFVGTAGYDSLSGGDAADTLIGGAGDDNLTGGAGDDYLDGGEGHDILNFSSGTNIANGITLDLRITGPQDTGAGMDTVLNIEQVVTTRFDDIVIGGDENLSVRDALGGNDTFVGNGGNDDLWINRYSTYTTPSTIMLDGGDGDDAINYLGAGLVPDRNTPETELQFRDTVTALGGAGDDFIALRGGRRSIIDAGDGNDVVGISIAGNTDRASYDITLGAGRDELAIQWGNRDIASFDRNDIVVRDFRGGADGDLLGLTAIVGQGLFTPAGAATSIGTFSPFLSGHVTLVKQGSDTLLQADKDGRFGASPMVTVMKLQGTEAFSITWGNVYAYILGGAVQRTVIYDPIITQYMAAGSTRLEGHAGRDSLQGAAGDDLLVGLAGDDFLNGFAGDDTLSGGAGADYMVGGAGNDVYDVDNAADYVGEVAGEGIDLVRTTVDWTLSAAFENIEVAGGAIRATGNALANVLTGGIAGQDTLAGLAGNDVYVVRDAGTAIVEATGNGTDQVVVATRSYTLAQGAAIELMAAATGSDAIDLTGNEFDQMLVAGAGTNALDGQGGFDIVSYRGATAGVVVDGPAMRGTGGDARGDTYRNVEAFEGSAFADRLAGDDRGMWLNGAAGDDWLIGGAGDDSLLGGSGSDVFAFNTVAVSGRDRVLDWSGGDRIATSKQLRGADANGFLTIATTGLVLLDGTVRGDTAELVDQGGAVLKALGRADGYWWYGFASGGDASFVDGRVRELAPVDVASGTAAMHIDDGGLGAGAGHLSPGFVDSPFYLYDAMGGAMSSGAMLTA